jgi:hypothetical protein
MINFALILHDRQSPRVRDISKMQGRTSPHPRPLILRMPGLLGFTLDYSFFKLIVMGAKRSLFLPPPNMWTKSVPSVPNYCNLQVDTKSREGWA